MIELFVEGIPAPQPRPRVCKNGHAYNPDTADAWKNSIMQAVFAHAVKTGCDTRLEGPVYVKMLFVLPRPKRRKHDLFSDVRPDLDNYVKAVLDALTDIKVWNDDGQVAQFFAEKAYVSCGGASGMYLTIKEIG